MPFPLSSALLSSCILILLHEAVLELGSDQAPYIVPSACIAPSRSLAVT